MVLPKFNVSRSNLTMQFTTDLLNHTKLIQQYLNTTLEEKDKALIKSIALEYQALGGSYRISSKYLFNSFNNSGEWENIAQILLGNSSKYSYLFADADSNLTDIELRFLNQLYLSNECLVNLLEDKENQLTKNIDATALKRVIGCYQNKLVESAHSLSH